jgi:hypothetical protein
MRRILGLTMISVYLFIVMHASVNPYAETRRDIRVTVRSNEPNDDVHYKARRFQTTNRIHRYRLCDFL